MFIIEHFFFLNGNYTRHISSFTLIALRDLFFITVAAQKPAEADSTNKKSKTG